MTYPTGPYLDMSARDILRLWMQKHPGSAVTHDAPEYEFPMAADFRSGIETPRKIVRELQMVQITIRMEASEAVEWMRNELRRNSEVAL